MVKNTKKLVRIDLNQFKLHLHLKSDVELTLHFNSPSRKFYLTVIVLVIQEMKKRGKITPIPLHKYVDVLALLNETVGGSAGSSKKEYLLPRIYRKWKDALPDLENAPLFKVIGRTKKYDELMDKIYTFSEEEKDKWANLFEYSGSHENVRLRFSIDRLGSNLDDILIIYGEPAEQPGLGTWDEFIEDLKSNTEGKSNYLYFNEKPEGQNEVPVLVKQGMESKSRNLKWALLVIIGLFAIVIGGGAFWHTQIYKPQVEIDSVEKKPLHLPEKPSIAVLPFRNLSDDREQEYFSDGMTDDIITDLSKINGLLVISKNSTFAYKGQDKKISEIVKDLNVRYVLEGSVRKSGENVRINAQLIDSNTDHHIWADRFDGKVENVFELQDRITQKIVSALSITLASTEQSNISNVETNNIRAYDLVLKGKSLIRQNTPESFAEASKFFKKAVELDPNYGRAYAELADLYWLGATFGLPFWKALNIEYFSGRNIAISYLDIALLNPTPKAHKIAAYVAISRRQFEKAAEEAQNAIELNPNDSAGYAALSFIYVDARPEEAIFYANQQLKLDPQSFPYSLYKRGKANFYLKNYEKTVELMERSGVHAPKLLEGNAFLVAAYAHLGRFEGASRIYNDLFLKSFGVNTHPIPEHLIHVYGIREPEMADLLINGLIKAGLPSQPDNYCRLSNEDKLSYKEVKKLVLGNTWTGYFWSSPAVPWWNHFSYDGVNTLMYGSNTIIREFGFKDERLYVLREVEGQKWKSVWTIFRNKRGNYDQRNEYIMLNESFVGPFSVEKTSK